MLKGIYNFVDKKNNMVVYIGKDSHIGKNNRYKSHLRQSLYDAQKFNRVLQNNPDRYEYRVICEYSDLTDDELNYLEIKEILKHKFLYDEIPKYNFSIGGDGCTGYNHTDEAKRKISEAKKGKNLSEEHKRKISESLKGRTFSDGTKQKMSESKKGKNNPHYGKIPSNETKQKISNANTKSYARIIKGGFYNGKQRYIIRYEGKNLKRSIHIHKLYKWFAKNYPNEYLYLEVNQT